MSHNKSNKKPNVSAISVEELNEIRGGESMILELPGIFASAIGDDVDIQSGDGFVRATSYSSNNSNSANSGSENSMSNGSESSPQLDFKSNLCGFFMM